MALRGFSQGLCLGADIYVHCVMPCSQSRSCGENVMLMFQTYLAVELGEGAGGR